MTVLIGILAAIAIPSWFGLIEARRVESAANQFAADLRLAHNRATNQIGTQSTVTLYHGQAGEAVGPDYMIRTGTNEQNRVLPGDTRITAPTATTVITFSGSGGTNFNGTVRVQSGNSMERITVNSATSEVQVLP